jgi:hypothetical protein
MTTDVQKLKDPNVDAEDKIRIRNSYAKGSCDRASDYLRDVGDSLDYKSPVLGFLAAPVLGVAKLGVGIGGLAEGALRNIPFAGRWFDEKAQEKIQEKQREIELQDVPSSGPSSGGSSRS